MITFVPDPGTILMCDFDKLGFQQPLMTKKRHVVVVQRRYRGNDPLTVLVVPFSTTTPRMMRPWHYRIPAGRYPYFSMSDVFVKGDMLTAVPVSALDRVNVNGTWSAPVLPRDEYAAIQSALREAIAI